MKAELISVMGDDLMVANTARVSFQKESKEFTWRKDKPKGSDEGIIEYLARENHWTPFGHPQIQLRMKAPVPIRTQCFKHKQGFVENEESRRYIESKPELFIPDSFRLAPSGNKKQGSDGKHPANHVWLNMYEIICNQAISVYNDMIKAKVAPEQARLVLPQGVYVNWIWTGSLAAFARFYNLRIDSHAQKEIQDLALQVGGIIAPLFPVSWKALTGNNNDKT
ncbi:thymidylate synthase [Rheinheimera phage Barba21A]|uniref:Thymidylate synthase n=1 Tax=Rheinheimera phage Barba21A TaxID=2849598 RepID=A0A4P8N802_9CAUD|nr:thymidylate synthase [Rheinheimera phage Barba21A]QCQ62264.1 thymidylate synthase [Rheinheimera phage Barba21A]